MRVPGIDPNARPICCGRPMNRNGRNGHGKRQHTCPRCGRSHVTGEDPRSQVRPRLIRTSGGWAVVEDSEGYPVRFADGRAVVYLGDPRVKSVTRALKHQGRCELCRRLVRPGDPYRWTKVSGKKVVRCEPCPAWGVNGAWPDPVRRLANSGGWQYLARFLVAWDLGRPLEQCEHVHHRNGNRRDDRPKNLELVEAWFHGRDGAYAVGIAVWRQDLGRFVQHREPVGPKEWPRWRWLLGGAARRGSP